MFRWLFKRRPPERRKVDISTTAYAEGGAEFAIRILDISAHGFCITRPKAADEGCQLSIMVPDYGEVVGRVIWTKDDRCGGRFLAPIPIDKLKLTPARV